MAGMWQVCAFARRMDARPRTCKNVEPGSAAPPESGAAPAMAKTTTQQRTKIRLKTERPRLHKVILVNDDYTPREFVVTVLKAEFRMTEDQAHKVMITAHRRGVC